MATNSGADKGTRNLVIVMVLFIVAVGVIFSLISSRSNSTAAIPAAVSEADGYGIVLNPDSTPQIDVYVDYQCPACRSFELINGKYLNEVIEAKKAKVVFHPMTFIGPESILAANAAGKHDIEDVTELHVQDTINEMLTRSTLISDAVKAGKLAVVGANYKLSLGEIHPIVIVGDIK